MNKIFRNINLLTTGLVILTVLVVTIPLYFSFTKTVQKSLVQEARNTSQVIAEFRKLYTTEVVSRTENSCAPAMSIYESVDGAIPLPATFSIMLGQRLSNGEYNGQVKLYSKYPFPWREETGGLRDDFAKSAWEFLSKYPDSTFFKEEIINDEEVIRYATGDILKKGCVNCHNTFKNSPKTDWKLNDLRGVLEIQKPTNFIKAETRANYLLSGSIILFGSFFLIFFIYQSLTYMKKENVSTSKNNQELKDLKLAFDKTAIVARADLKGDILEVNDKFCEISKYPREELIGQNHRILNSGYHSKEFFVDMWRTIASGEVWRGIIKNKAKDGSFYWVDSTLIPIKDENERVRQYVAIRFDISLLKETEEKLKISVEENDGLTKSLKDITYALDETAIVAITNEKGIIEKVNDKFCEISKFSRDELIGQDHRILNSGFHEKGFFKFMWSTIGKGKIWQGEVKNRAKDGTFYWVDTKIVPLINEKGKPFKYVAIRFDITSRKETERMLRVSSSENENLSKELQDITRALDETAIIAITNEKGIIEKVNDKFCEISKYSREELIGQDHRILNSGYHEKDFFKNMWATIGRGQIWQAEVKNKARDGNYYWVDTHIVPLLTRNGKPKKYVAIRFDITSRKYTEEQLKESITSNEELSKSLEDIYNAIDEAAIVAITNEKGIIEKVNDKFCELSKYSPKELIGHDHKILNSGHHGKEFFKNMWATIGRGYIWRGQVKNRAKDGTFYWVDTHIVPLLNEKGKPFKYVAIRFDITSKVATEEDLRQALGDIEKYTKVFSHELKTPLRGISTLAEFVKDDLEDNVNKDIKENLDLIKTRAHSISNLVNGLLQFSEVNLEEKDVRFDSGEVMNHLVKNFDNPIIIQGGWPEIRSKRMKFMQVVGRLIDNAINFNPKEEKQVIVNVREKVFEYEFSVQDNGPGIKDVYQDKIFELFQSFNNKEENSSKGVGLTITRKLVNQLGGEIWIESDGESGSTFYFTIPKKR